MAGVIKREISAMVADVKTAGAITVGAAGVLWAVNFVNWVTGWAFLDYGVVPRTVDGLWGLLTMPFLHGGWGHLLANTLAGVPLAMMAMERKKSDLAVVTAVTMLTSGLGCWLLGATGSVHVGASGVIFGLIGFLLGRGIWERRAGPMIMSVVVGFLFGGSLFTMIPGIAAGISWQAHLFGFVGGLLCAKLMGGTKAKAPPETA
ncbi:MAG TPA: rhomboid family intramembrane serine protease [Myxococcota bacterium]|nr:rhomboid family intramembrane serine protease [Myxococcota bacterium]